MKTLQKKLSWFIVYAISMGFLEAAVVIYLRALLYPDGFDFPLRPMNLSLAAVEIFREAATILMLIGVGYLAGHNKLQRFAYFSLAFAVWDIFYYVFLYAFLGWPQSLATWDILFLLPLPWVGPVWAPCVLSLLMIVGSLFVIHKTEQDPSYSISRIHWLSLITGAVICILAFLWDFIQYRDQNRSLIPENDLFESVATYIPGHFNLPVFLAGLFLMTLPVVINMLATIKTQTPKNN